MAATNIEWTDATWNPVAGCTVLSPGCTNCYAMRMAARLDAMGQAKYRALTRRDGGRYVWSGAVRCDDTSLSIPLQWRKPRFVFVNSMSDLFHADVPESFIRKVWKTMGAAQWHTFQVLTKRPERMRKLAEHLDVLPNVWLGTSVENSDYLWRLGELRATPAVVRFASFEPLLGPVNGADLNEIHWAIVGGESGPRARPLRIEWVRAIRDLCDEQGVPFFFKQWGGTRKKHTGRELDGRIWDAKPVPSARPRTRMSEVASPRQTKSLLKCVWVAAAPVLCLHSRGTAWRSTRRASGSHRRDARSPAACC